MSDTTAQQPIAGAFMPPPPPPAAAAESPAEDHDDLQSDDGSGDVLGALDFAFDAHALEGKDIGGTVDAASKNTTTAATANATDKGLVSSIDWSSFQQQVSTTALSPQQTQLSQQQQQSQNQNQSSAHFASLHGPSVSGLMVGPAAATTNNNDASALLPALAGHRGPASQSSHGSGQDKGGTVKPSPSPGADKLVRSTDSGSQRKSPNVPLRSRNVYVAALPINFSEADLTALLSEFGKVKSCRMFNSGARVNDIGRAYGFALFEEPGSAERAVAALDGKPLGNARIQCQLSRNGVVKKPKDVRERARITMANKEAVNTTPSKSPVVSAFLSQSQEQQQPHSSNNNSPSITAGGAQPTNPMQQAAPPQMPPQHHQHQHPATASGVPPMLPHPGQLPFNSFIAAPPQQHQQYQQQGQQTQQHHQHQHHHHHHGMFMGQQGMMPPPFPNQNATAAGHQQHQFYAPQQQQHQQQGQQGMQMPQYMTSAQPPTGGAVPVMTPQGIVWMRAA
jgi:hypothetical protein